MKIRSRLKPLLQGLGAALLALTLPACGPTFATRYATGNAALSTGEGPVYFVVIAPLLQQALNRCIPMGTPGASPTLVVVADVDGAGRAQNLDIEPDSPGTDCVAQALLAGPLPRPPLAAGETSFPIGLKIEAQ